MTPAIIVLGLVLASWGFHPLESEGTFSKSHKCVDAVAPNLVCTEGEKRLQSVCHSTECSADTGEAV